MSVTTFADPVVSSLRSLSFTPTIMTGVFLWLLRTHFSAPGNNIVSEALRDFIYKDRDPTTGITIDPATLWDPTKVEARPAIYVKRLAWKPNPGALSISDKYQSRGPSKARIDNGDRYEMLISGAHALFCVGRRPAEVEELAAEVFFRMIEFAQHIRHDFDLHKFTVDELGESAKLEESSEHFVVPVTVRYVKAHGWLIRQLGPYMKSISMNMKV
jgi:hypothetical protein